MLLLSLELATLPAAGWAVNDPEGSRFERFLLLEPLEEEPLALLLLLLLLLLFEEVTTLQLVWLAALAEETVTVPVVGPTVELRQLSWGGGCWGGEGAAPSVDSSKLLLEVALTSRSSW